MTTFLLSSCFSAHPTNTISQNIGEMDAWAVLSPQMCCGETSPSPLWVSAHGSSANITQINFSKKITPNL